jgi:four helix bundle protein
MIARRYEELEAWQVADELRREVLALTQTGPASTDFKFRDQIRDAASSAARNISEGFGRFRPPDFARFMDFSLSSSMETQDLLAEGIQRKYFTTERTKPALQLARRSIQVSRALLRYLKSCRKVPRTKSDSPPNEER